MTEIIDFSVGDTDGIDPENDKKFILALTQENESQTIEVTLIQRKQVFTLNKLEAMLLVDALTRHIQEWKE